MLKHTLTHPQISAVLARAGHHAKILIADGNYPASTKKGAGAVVVCLNLSPGVVTVAQALRAIAARILRPVRSNASYRPSGLRCRLEFPRDELK